MSFFVCTLFEKHYHYGVAALVNSLYHNQYRGVVYAGYKGELPAWCRSGKTPADILWEGASALQIAEGLQVYFLPLKTDVHLTFYKPNFMLDLFRMVEGVDGIAYFDPDIVVKCRWEAFEVWMGHGVALVQESLTRPATHPLRGEWKKVIHTIDRKTVRDMHAYINGGFCGVAKQHIEFLRVWLEVMEAATKHFNLVPSRWGQTSNRTYLFFNADQDALNITTMCCDVPISEVSPDGMDLLPGGFVMSHALGAPKPWKKRFIRSALQGLAPTQADKGFWHYSTGPVRLYSKALLSIQRLKISIASFIGRFYRRS